MPHFFTRAFASFCLLFVLAGCSKNIPLFAPPAQRPQPAANLPWEPGKFLALAYHDVEDAEPDQRFVSVRTDHLIEQMAWLRENGYRAVSIDQILDARQGGKPLPEKAVLLSFDDGYSSFYRRVFPLLKAYGWSAVLAPAGAWIDTPLQQDVDFGGERVERDRFTTWPQIGEMAASGLVEIGAHTNALHYGILANPQGNLEPAASTRKFDPVTAQYETDAQYQTRVRHDVEAISASIRSATGKSPRVWVWPYGAVGGTALKIVGENGYQMSLTLEDGVGRVDGLMNVPRYLVSNAPSLAGFASAVAGMEAKPLMRVAHIDLDYVYDADPAQMDRNLGLLVQRIADMQITTVFLQAFADPDADGLVRSVYFPNRWLPMRADLFNRAAWQLTTRAHVEVYAWMPVLSFDLDPSLPRVTRWEPAQKNAEPMVDTEQYRRLSPFDPIVRRRIADLYEDLASHARFDGILYHDDAVLTDFEDAGPQALQAYRAAGLPGSIEALRADPETMRRWTRFKSRYLVDFTADLTRHVRAIRGPQVKTARNLFAGPILDPRSEEWFAQNLDDFLAAYDWTAPMAMPLMESVPPKDAEAWLDRLVDAVAARPGALDRTVFELQAVDWRAEPGAGPRYLDTARLGQWMSRLQLRGARSFGYYPDDFPRNHPRLETIRPAISNAWYPLP